MITGRGWEVRAGGGGSSSETFTRSTHQYGVMVHPLEYLTSASQDFGVHPGWYVLTKYPDVCHIRGSHVLRIS
jgi:hypothetical protein